MYAPVQALVPAPAPAPVAAPVLGPVGRPAVLNVDVDRDWVRRGRRFDLGGGPGGRDLFRAVVQGP